MSGENLIDLLSPLISDELALPLEPDFSTLVNDNLAGVADPTDGFDGVLEDLISIVDSLEGGLATLGGADGGDLDDAFLEILALDADAPGVDVANLTAALPDVQTNVDGLGTLLTGAGLPTPPASGGAGAGGCSSFDFGPRAISTAGAYLSYPQQFTIANNGSVPVTIIGVTFAPPQSGIFMMDPLPNGEVIQPGGTVTITVVFSPQQPITYTALMTVLTNAPDPQPCVNLTGTGTGQGLLGGPPAGGPSGGPPPPPPPPPAPAPAPPPPAPGPRPLPAIAPGTIRPIITRIA